MQPSEQPSESQPPVPDPGLTPTPNVQPPYRWRPSYRAVRALVMLALVVLVMGWIGIRALLHHGAKTPSTPQATVATDAANVCADNARMQTADYKAGTGQPIALYARSSTAADHYQGIYVLGMAPVGSAAQSAYVAVGKNLTTTYSTKKTPVVVACITRSSEQPTDQICHYDDGKNVPVYTASYHLTVYEAKTRKVLRSVDVPAEQTYTCTSFTAYDGKGFYRAWDKSTVALALEPFAQ